MHMQWLVTAALALTLGAPATVTPQTTVNESNAQVEFGRVEALDLKARTLEVRGQIFQVPRDVEGLEELDLGNPVAVYYTGRANVIRLVWDIEPM